MDDDGAATARTPAPDRSLAFHAGFRRLWIGDALGQLGAQLTVLALPVYAVTRLDVGTPRLYLVSE